MDLDQERYKIAAKINTIGDYSSHVDQQGSLRFVTGMRPWPEKVRIVHSDARAKRELVEHLKVLYKQAQCNPGAINPQWC